MSPWVADNRRLGIETEKPAIKLGVRLRQSPQPDVVCEGAGIAERRDRAELGGRLAAGVAKRLEHVRELIANDPLLQDPLLRYYFDVTSPTIESVVFAPA